METVILIVVIFFIYFLPSIIGWNKKGVDGIIALNLFLGWTFIGWVGSLVWALSASPNNTEPMHYAPPVDKIEKLKQLQDLLDSKAITKEEFDAEKKKIWH